MEREWENGERERKWREIEEIERERENGERFPHFPSILSSSLHYLIFSTFPLHFLILSPFSHSLAILFGEEIKERTSNWRGNGERMRKWREREKMERDWGNRKRERKWREISSFSLHSLFLSPLSHFLYISSPFSHSLAIFSFSCYFLFLSPFPQFLSISKIDQSLYAQIYCWSALWTNSSKIRTPEEMADGTCIIQMRHASIHRMNQEQWGDFKKRRAN